jgi:hypothetical protein
VTRQVRAAWWAIPLAAGLLLLFIGVLLGFQTPDAAELPPGAKAQYACGSPFRPGEQQDVATCRTSLHSRKGKAETALVIGGILVVIGGAIALVQRRGRPNDQAHDQAREHELRPA